jgi:hypothetical protein
VTILNNLRKYERIQAFEIQSRWFRKKPVQPMFLDFHFRRNDKKNNYIRKLKYKPNPVGGYPVVRMTLYDFINPGRLKIPQY